MNLRETLVPLDSAQRAARLTDELKMTCVQIPQCRHVDAQAILETLLFFLVQQMVLAMGSREAAVWLAAMAKRLQDETANLEKTSASGVN